MDPAVTIDRPMPAVRRTALRWPLVGAGCVALAALSLLAGHETSYDPTAWLIWGREILHADLSTSAGPSWKPLPSLVITPAALLGDSAQQIIWLLVARAGTLAAVALAYRLAWRLAGPVAGAIAACALLLSSGFLSRDFRGTSEGLLAAFGLGAVEAHLAGRRWVAFALLAATALLRPEMWAFAMAYGLWLAWTARPGAVRRRALAVTAGTGVVVVAAWLIPEKLGSGQLLRAASRALEPVVGSPAAASRPFVATFTNAASVVPWPLYAAGVALVATAAVAAIRSRELTLPVALAALATALMVVVAAMAEGGFTGTIRYLTIPIALTCVLGGAGCVHVARLVRGRLPAGAATAVLVLAAVIAAPFVADAAARTRDEMRGGLGETRAYAALPGAIARAGGVAAVLRCGTVWTTSFDTQTVARALHVHEFRVGFRPRVPGTIVARRGTATAADPRFGRFLAVTKRWVIRTTCAR